MKDRFTQMLKDMDLNYPLIVDITGLKYNTVKCALKPSERNIPKWAKLSVYIYERLKWMKEERLKELNENG